MPSIKTKFLIGFHLTAAHEWVFIRIFPLLFGELLADDIFYKHYLQLIEIFFLLNGDSYTEEKILILEKNI